MSSTFATEFIRGAEAGRQAADRKKRLEMEEEDRKLQKEELQIRLKQLGLQSKLALRKAAQEEAQFMETMPGRKAEQTGVGGPATVPHQPVTLPAVEEAGLLETQVQPRTLEDVVSQSLTAKLQAAREQARVEAEGKRQQVPAGLAGKVGLPEGATDPGTLAAATNVFEAERRGKEGAANRQTQLDVAKTYAGARGGLLNAPAYDSLSDTDRQFVDRVAHNYATGEYRNVADARGQLGGVKSHLLKAFEERAAPFLAIDQPTRRSLGEVESARDIAERLQGLVKEYQKSPSVQLALVINRERDTLKPYFARSFGNRGALTEIEQDRGVRLLSGPIAALVMPGVTERSFQELFGLFDAAERGIIGSRGRTFTEGAPGTGAGTAPAAGKADPLGIR